MKLTRENITAREWSSILKTIAKLAKNIESTYGKSFGKPLIARRGLSQIPITNSDWAAWVGYEHEEQTLWFKQILRRSPSGYLVKCLYGPPSLLALAKSVVWNAAMYIHFLQKPLSERAMYKAILQSLQDSSCPEQQRQQVADATATLCTAILASVSDSNGKINRCAIQLLKDDLDTRLGPRTCTNRNLRRNLCKQLLIRGIATLNSRTMQQNMLREAVKNEPRLKGSAVRSIERMLILDKRLIEINDGVTILLPYTTEEISKIHADTKLKSNRLSTENRVLAIKEKIRNCETLSGADRKFKSKHKRLFV